MPKDKLADTARAFAGRHLIEGRWVRSKTTTRSTPWKGGGHDVYVAEAGEIDSAASAAQDAFEVLYATDGQTRAALLDRIAAEIDARGDRITAIGHAETALPEARLEGERARTCAQLRLFAVYLRDGRHLETRTEDADPNATPPRPRLHMEMRPIGPVAVFGASNFPLAFSVAGGDTASALAAGCPVIVKGHEAHPGTSEVVAEAIQAALAAEGLPSGIFALLQGPGPVTGAELVRHPAIKAVGFTGSTRAGRALYDLCAARPEPIPFYGELGSLNPVFLLPGALAARLDEIARSWATSLTLGAGQFCTNPSIVVVSSEMADAFTDSALIALSDAPTQPMLTDGIAAALARGTEAAANRPGVTVVRPGGAKGRDAAPTILACDAATWLADDVLREEVFGPTALIVRADPDEMVTLARAMPGQLTATLHLEPSDHTLADRLLPWLERAAGRVLFDGFPTGVAVSDAMVHGGPWPASTNFGHSAVGTFAIKRWQRAVCWQEVPDGLAAFRLP